MDIKILKDFEILYASQDWHTLRSWFRVNPSLRVKVDKCIILGTMFLPHYFKVKSPPVQAVMLSKYLNDINETVAYPRGFAKTTNMQLAIMYMIIAELEKYIVIIEKTFMEASEVLEAIYNEFRDNELIRMVWGDLIEIGKEKRVFRAKNRDARGDKFIGGVRLRAIGFNKPIRGIKSRQYRPTKIFMDDVESDEHINSIEQRAKYMRNYTNSIVPAPAKGGSIKHSGTILHQDSLLMNNLTKQKGRIYKAFYTPELDKDYNTIKLPEYVITNNKTAFAQSVVKLLWPEYWSWDELMRKREDMMLNESNNAFFQEYRNEPTAEEERYFKHEWLYNPSRIICIDEILKSGKEYSVKAMVDCAESLNEKSDWTACIVLFIDTAGNWYPISVKRQRRNILSQVDLVFELWDHWHPYGLEVIGMEKKAFNDQIKPMIDNEMYRRKSFPNVQELRHLGKHKLNRIVGGLQPLYERGMVWTVVDSEGKPIEDTEELKNELYDFGKAKHDDLADALAYGCDLATRPNESTDTVAHSVPSDDPYANSGGSQIYIANF